MNGRPAAAPGPAPPDGGRLGMVERLAGIANRMTLQNVINIGILVLIMIPAYGAWRFLTDEALRNDLLNTVTQRGDIYAGCDIYETKIGGVKRYHIAAFVAPGPDGNDYLVSGRLRDGATPEDLKTVCVRLIMLADKLRNLQAPEDYPGGGTTP